MGQTPQIHRAKDSKRKTKVVASLGPASWSEDRPQSLLFPMATGPMRVAFGVGEVHSLPEFPNFKMFGSGQSSRKLIEYRNPCALL